MESALIAIVEAHPNPPRPVSLARVAGLAMGELSTRFVVAVGLLFTCVAALVALLETPPWRAWPVWLALVLGVFMICAPLLYVVRVWRGIAYGRLALAEVLTVTYSPPGSRDTIDSLQNGIARGRWRIVMPTARLDKDFETDAPWAGSLRTGTPVRVLVDTAGRKVLVPLGPDRSRHAG